MPATLDDVWIPLVAAQGWLIITRDRHIQSRPAELAAVREHGAKMVNLTSDAAGSTWEQLRVALSINGQLLNARRASQGRLSTGPRWLECR
jgi:flagellar biosynthesis/type III secretory pathway chaperone